MFRYIKSFFSSSEATTKASNTALNEIIDNWSDLPTIDIGSRTGSTDYIDFIKPEEVSHSLMRGVDVYGRNFLTIKAEIHDSKGTIWQVFETFFQRYNDCNNIWVGCGHYGVNFMDTYSINKEQAKLLRDLVVNKSINLDPQLVECINMPLYLENKLKNNDAVPVMIKIVE